VLRWQGLRIGEALRIDWVHVSWQENSIFVAESKSGEPRTVTMHKRSRAALHALWVSRGSPREGRVFLAPLLLPKREGDVDWINWAAVNWSEHTITIEMTSGDRRAVALAPRTFEALLRLWRACGSPTEGKVQRRNLGSPYADTRQYSSPTGSPIKKAHATACKRAGIANFTVHDWRHHWACQCVMAGIDLETIKQEGGAGNRFGWWSAMPLSVPRIASGQWRS
jgi:integrase